MLLFGPQALVGNPRLPQQLKEKVLCRLKDKRHAEPPRKLLCEEVSTSEANGARKVRAAIDYNTIPSLYLPHRLFHQRMTSYKLCPVILSPCSSAYRCE